MDFSQRKQKRKIEEDAKSKFDCGEFLARKGEFEKAIELELESLKLYRDINDKDNEQVVSRYLGVNYRRISQYQNALEMSNKSLKIAQERKNRDEEAKTLQDIAVCLFDDGKPKKAICNYLRSLKLYEELDDEASVQSLCRKLGIHFRSTSNYAEAILYYEKARVIAQKLEDKQNQYRLCRDLEDIYRETDDTVKVLEYSTEAMKIELLLSDEDKIRQYLVEISKHLRRSMKTEAADARASQPTEKGSEGNSNADIDNQTKYGVNEERELQENVERINQVIQWWDSKTNPSRNELLRKLEGMGHKDVVNKLVILTSMK